MKTIRELLEQLPDEAREKAIKYTKPSILLEHKSSTGQTPGTALMHAFDWEKTPEGFDYWFEIMYNLKSEI